MSLPLDPIPVQDPFVERQVFMGERFYRWLSQLVARVLTGAQVLGSVHRTGLSSSVAATTVLTPVNPGAVRVSLSVQVTTPGTVSSSLSATLTWKAGGVTQTETLAALTGNTTTTRGGISVMVYPDSGQPIQYTTTYASVGGTAMVYGVDVVVEGLT